MRFRQLHVTTLMIILLVVVASTSCRGDDVVLQWNRTVLDSIRAEKTPPPVATRVLAMTHIAIYDALNRIEGKFDPYYYSLPRTKVPAYPADTSASTAAYFVLKSLYPNREPLYRAQWQASIKPANGPIRNAQAIAWGTMVAQLVLRDRANDGSANVVNYQPGTNCGAWQPTAPFFASALLPQWPGVRPFGISSVSNLRPVKPPGFDTASFGLAYREVKSLGAANSTTRTSDQTQIAYFWEDGAGSVTPPGHWQTIAQDLSLRRGLSRMNNARLFALLSIAQADAAICAWDAKYQYNYFRPVTGIQAPCFSRPDLAPDPAWLPLIATPPFPAYTSGHSTFSAASARLLALYFGTDNISFSGMSPDPNRWPAVLPGVVRSWSSLSQAAAEAGQSRIYGGIHWQFDNTEGLAIGRLIGGQVFDVYLKRSP